MVYRRKIFDILCQKATKGFDKQRFGDLRRSGVRSTNVHFGTNVG